MCSRFDGIAWDFREDAPVSDNFSKHQKREPHDCASNATLGQIVWWYEEAGGIGIYATLPILPTQGGTRMALIPWRSIRAALKRKDQI